MSWLRGLGVAVAAVGLVGGTARAAKPVVTVAADGSGQFKTVQAALDSVGDSVGDAGMVVRIAPGVYKEKLQIAKNGVELRGMGSQPQDVVLTWDDSHASTGGTGKSASVTVTGDDFRAENLTIQNDWEKTHARTQEGSQAVALYITGDREVLRRVRLLGYQDTLYAGSRSCHAAEDATAGKVCQAARMLFADCYIEGHVDFIFGDAKAVFDHCTLHGMANPTVMLTAQSRLFPEEDSGYLFLDCTVTADKGVGQLVMGRPWRAYSTVYFVNTKVVGTKIAAAGWSDWDGKLKTSSYGEYNTGPGADVSQRIAGTRQLSKAEAEKLSVTSWLGEWQGLGVRD